jgi:hypothetical protein
MKLFSCLPDISWGDGGMDLQIPLQKLFSLLITISMVGLISTTSVVPKCGARPPGAQEILKGGARGAKLFYSQKINKKHKCN